jgi:hypothetical protein
MLTRRWLLRHVLLLAVITAFLLLGRWQWVRADAGNARSVGYAFEWPLFAAFAIFWWWRLLHLEAHPPTDADRPQPVQGAPGELGVEARAAAEAAAEPDEELDAYNAYLARLNQQDQQRQRPAR